MKSKNTDNGKLRIGDDWNAIRIIALSQSNPLKAIAEFVENSIDAHAKTITITRGREHRAHYLAIKDDGDGVPHDPEGRYVQGLVDRRMYRPQPVRSCVAVLVYLGLSGCIPMRYSYEHIDVPDARYFKSICYHTFGPPAVAYYPFHGIFISLDVTNTIELGLHLPAGTTVVLNGNSVHITGSAGSGSIDTTIPIRAARHDYVREGDPLEFSARDTFTSADNFGPLLGDTSNGRNLWYSFISVTSEPIPHVIQTPRGLIRGTVELPPITINGQSYKSQSIPFERRVHTEIAPINC